MRYEESLIINSTHFSMPDGRRTNAGWRLVIVKDSGRGSLHALRRLDSDKDR